MLKDNLIKLGFTPNQTDVYLALIQTGQTKVGPLIKITDFHRNIVYRALEDLKLRRLVSKIEKRGVAYYSPNDPEPILFETKQLEILANDAVKEIKSLHKQSCSEAIVLQGRQGILDLMDIMLQEGEDVYLIGAQFQLPGFLTKEEVARYKKLLLLKKIRHYALIQPSIKNIPFQELVDKIRVLPKILPTSPLVIWIFGKAVAHVLWEEPQTIFLIKNKKIADGYRDYFKLLWKQSTPLKKWRRTQFLNYKP